MFNDYAVDFCPCACYRQLCECSVEHSITSGCFVKFSDPAKLLKELVWKVESGVHVGVDLFMRCKCWTTSVFNSKTATNVEAKSQINYLEQCIDTDNVVFILRPWKEVSWLRCRVIWLTWNLPRLGVPCKTNSSSLLRPTCRASPLLGRGSSAFGVWLSNGSFVAFAQDAKVMGRHNAVLVLLFSLLSRPG